MKYGIWILIIVALLFILGRIVLNINKPYQNVTSEELQPLLDSLDNPLLLDVRTPKEVDEGAIPGYVHMDYYSKSFRDELRTLEKGKPIIIYCHCQSPHSKFSYRRIFFLLFNPVGPRLWY